MILLPEVILPFEVGKVSRLVVVEVEEVVSQLFGRGEVVDVDHRLWRTHRRVVARAHHDRNHGEVHHLNRIINQVLCDLKKLQKGSRDCKKIFHIINFLRLSGKENFYIEFNSFFHNIEHAALFSSGY